MSKQKTNSLAYYAYYAYYTTFPRPSILYLPWDLTVLRLDRVAVDKDLLIANDFFLHTIKGNKRDPESVPL
jgi:hypothetical protein